MRRARGSRPHLNYGTRQGCKRNSIHTVISQSPLGGAFIAQPIVLDKSLLLARADKRRRTGLSRLAEAIGLHQKKASLSKLQERFAAL